MSWTEERVEQLKKLWTEGHSASQIANQLGGVTRNAVIGKVHRLGLSGRATPSRPVKRPPRLARPKPAPQRVERPVARVEGARELGCAQAARHGDLVVVAPVADGVREFGALEGRDALSQPVCRVHGLDDRTA